MQESRLRRIPVHELEPWIYDQPGRGADFYPCRRYARLFWLEGLTVDQIVRRELVGSKTVTKQLAVAVAEAVADQFMLQCST